MIQWKLGCWSRKQKRKNQPIARLGIEHCHWFILPLLLVTPTMQFSLDRKQWRHQQNQCSASDSVGLIFTRWYCSTLLITTPTTTPSLVKTSLKETVVVRQWGVLKDNLVLSTGLIIWIGHSKEIWKLKFWALALHLSEYTCRLSDTVFPVIRLFSYNLLRTWGCQR